MADSPSIRDHWWDQTQLKPAFLVLVLAFASVSIYGIEELRYYEQSSSMRSLMQELNTTKDELQKVQKSRTNLNNELYDTKLNLQAANQKLGAYEEQIYSLEQANSGLNWQLGQVKAEAGLMSQCIAEVQPFLEHTMSVQTDLRSASGNPVQRLFLEGFGAHQDLNSFMDSWKFGVCRKAEPILNNYR